MRFLKSFTLALALFAMAGIQGAKAEVDTADVVAGAYAGGTAGTMFAVSMSGGGGMIALGGFGMIAYCQATMQKNAAGVVTYQNPKCSGGGPVYVGNLTQNPYVTPPNPCVKNARGEYKCAR